MKNLIKVVGLAGLALLFGLGQPVKALEVPKDKQEETVVQKNEQLSELVNYIHKFGKPREDGGCYLEMVGDNGKIYFELIPLFENSYKIFFLKNTDKVVPLEEIPEQYRQEMKENEPNGEPIIMNQVQISKVVTAYMHFKDIVVVKEGNAFVEKDRDVFFSRRLNDLRIFFGEKSNPVYTETAKTEELFDWCTDLFLERFRNYIPIIPDQKYFIFDA